MTVRTFPAGPVSLDSVRVEFNEERLVSDAGLLVVATLGERLGIEETVNESLWLDPRGTFLRAFTFGHVRQLDRVLDVTLGRAWEAGAGPGDGPLVIDIDSFIGEVYGYEKQGASYGYTHKRG